MTTPIARSEAVDLLATMQAVVVDLTAITIINRSTLSASEMQDARYIMGMAAASSALFERLLAAPGNFLRVDALERSLVEDARSFVAALHGHGVGLTH